jgi:hypothetical protein
MRDAEQSGPAGDPPPDEPVNVLMVTLPTNFKVAKFDDEKSTQFFANSKKTLKLRASTRRKVKLSCP